MKSIGKKTVCYRSFNIDVSILFIVRTPRINLFPSNHVMVLLHLIVSAWRLFGYTFAQVAVKDKSKGTKSLGLVPVQHQPWSFIGLYRALLKSLIILSPLAAGWKYILQGGFEGTLSK